MTTVMQKRKTIDTAQRQVNETSTVCGGLGNKAVPKNKTLGLETKTSIPINQQMIGCCWGRRHSVKRGTSITAWALPQRRTFSTEQLWSTDRTAYALTRAKKERIGGSSHSALNAMVLLAKAKEE